MYLPKHIGLWRLVRQMTEDDPGHALWSIGAGPLLDVIGWFWSSGRVDSRRVVGVDVLSWEGVRDLAEWKSLAKATIGPHEYDAGVSFLPAHLQPQVAGRAVRLLSPDLIDQGATVLFPFVLNHVFGSAGPAQDAGIGAVREFMVNLRQRDCRIIVADMHLISSTTGFWEVARRILPGLPAPSNLSFDPTDVSGLYADHQGGRRTSKYMRQACVGVLDGNGGRFL